MKDICLENSLNFSFISINKKEEEKFILKLKKIIKMLDKISFVEIKSNFEFECFDINSLSNDEATPSLLLKHIKKFSNSFLDGYFLSPKILE